MRQIVGIYIRMVRQELYRLRDQPNILPKYDVRVPLADGRGLDLGRAWEELGVFLDGGVHVPDVGPTVGELPLPNADGRAEWSYIEPERVAVMSQMLKQMHRERFDEHYAADTDDTQPSLPGARTAGWGDRAAYLYGKLRALSAHYAKATEQGQGMLVRIGERL